MNSAVIFLLIFVGVPLLELYFLIEVGAEIGAIPTIFLSVFTAVLGGMLVRVQGFTTLLRVREAMGRDEVPALEMLEGAVLLICGVMLLLPGFFTDAVGFLLLVPPIRRWLLVSVLKRARVLHVSKGKAEPREGPDRRVIEGEYKREDD